MERAGDGPRRFERNIEYGALPSQKVFHRSTARFKGFSGPIGSGKSQALCQEAIRLSYLNPGRLGLIGAPTYPMLRDATQVALIELLEQNKLPYELNKSDKTIVMKDTRSRIILRSVDQFERLRGSNLAWFGVDELTYTCEQVWMRLEGRLRDPLAPRLCGFAVWTPKGRDWVYRRFVAEKVPGYDVVLAKPFENRHLLNQVPDFYERLKSSYDEKFYQQEILGDYLCLQDGVVYHGFDRTANLRHVDADWREPLFWALDFNVEPMCSVVAQKRGDELQVLDEIVLHRASTLDACEEFYRRHGGHTSGLIVFGDASGSRRQTTGGSDYETIRAFFTGNRMPRFQIRVARSNPPVRDRVGLVNAFLKAASGERRLYIDPRCKELVKDLEEVVYRGQNGEIDKTKDGSRTHLSDALGYVIWEEFRPRVQMGEQLNRLM